MPEGKLFQTCDSAADGRKIARAVGDAEYPNDISMLPLVNLRPRLLAAADALAHLGLEVGWAEGKPLLADAVEQRPALGGREGREPLQCLRLGAVADRDCDVDREPPPRETGSQQDYAGSVGAHPLRQRTARREPAAHERAARILRPRFIDRAVVSGAERARLSRVNRMAVDRDLQPAVAACGARVAAPRRFACRRHKSMIPKSGYRFSEKIMLQQ